MRALGPSGSGTVPGLRYFAALGLFREGARADGRVLAPEVVEPGFLQCVPRVWLGARDAKRTEPRAEVEGDPGEGLRGQGVGAGLGE